MTQNMHILFGTEAIDIGQSFIGESRGPWKQRQAACGDDGFRWGKVNGSTPLSE